MRASYTAVLSAALAAGALAIPFPNKNLKRDNVVELVTDYTTVFHTEYLTLYPTAPAAATPSSDTQGDDHRGHNQYKSFKDFTKTYSHHPHPTAPAPTIEPPAASTTVEKPATTSQPPATTPPAPTTPTPTPTTSPVPVSPADNSFESEVLAVHNAKRALHGSGPLTYNYTMADHAMKASAACIMFHVRGLYGENKAQGHATPTAAIEDWYAEEEKYDYTTGGFSDKTGHFTQVVWKAATKVGCGLAYCGTTPYFTCNYDTGNVKDAFSDNVLPKK